MDPADFRRHGHALVEWIADYLTGSERYPVLSRVSPGDVRLALPAAAPEHGEPFDAIFADFERVLVPALTHWNHPGFFGYFAITASAPGVLAEFLAAALNQQAMLWRTSPAATELEEVSLGWLRDLMGLPAAFEGVIYDTASISSLHALAAAREAAVPGVREFGLTARSGVGSVRVYCSEQAHSSIDKAVMLLGLGHRALRKIPVDDRFRMRTAALRDAIADDRAAGMTPLAVVATIGTTSTTSIDPVGEIAEICRREGVWLHVDAAYAGVTAIMPEFRARFEGWQHADSIVVNPHKWLFTPFDLSAFYCRRMDVVRQAFSLVPDYLNTAEGTRGVRNLMDTGVQLGRRFRSLKLWMVLRHFGAEGIREALAEHIRLAQLFSGWLDADPDFERLAPVPFSVVCFRARPRGGPTEDTELDAVNERLLDAVNATGEVFLSHTRVHDRFTLRLAVGHLRTKEHHVARAWELLKANINGATVR
ncbi:MAG: amino acid decarboxylase [Acidobacteria bacterium]|nr:amino acid decarboxylase [Acidobacteriota bacterium]